MKESPGSSDGSVVGSIADENQAAMPSFSQITHHGAIALINTSFIERQNATDRHHNARKSRKTYRFSKDWRYHEAATYFTMYSYNFCWQVRTLRESIDEGRWIKRTPAMAAGLADHVWPMSEWVSRPVILRS